MTTCARCVGPEADKEENPEKKGCCGCCEGCNCNGCKINPNSCNRETCNPETCGDYCCCKPGSRCNCKNPLREKHSACLEQKFAEAAEQLGGEESFVAASG